MILTDDQKLLAADLKPKELAFANLYSQKHVNKLSNVDMYGAAGWSVKNYSSAASSSSKLLKKDNVVKYLDSLKESAIDGIDINVNGLITRLKQEVGYDKLHKLPEYVTASSIATNIKTLMSYVQGAERAIEPFDLGDGSDLEKLDLITKAMASGEIPINLGDKLINSIKAKVDLQEKLELEERLVELEKDMEWARRNRKATA